MKITVVGTGYVGLVTGACLAEVGTEVVCVDVNHKKIENLRAGILPIYEPGLDIIVERNARKGRLSFSTDLQTAIERAQVVFIAVGTPPDEDGSADLQYVLSVATDIGKYMKDYIVVVTKSTVPVGTAAKVKSAIASALSKRAENIEFDVASNPEFLKEGAAVDDFLKPDRIVIGVEGEKAKQILQKLYTPFVLNNHPLMFMDLPSAEMTKYAANAMLATKISFMNDIANLCDLVGADVNMVRRGIGSDNRIGNKFIYPGIGYGGSCFPKDVKALVRTAKEFGYNLRILQSVDDVNNLQKEVLFRKIMKHFGGDVQGKKFALWGLSFKPNTDDIREAPALVLIDLLFAAGAEVCAYDPVAMPEAKHLFGNKIKLEENALATLDGADALMLVTEWAEFRLPDWDAVKGLLREAVVFDGRNIYSPEELHSKGFVYYGIGVNSKNQK